jgi:hypothetical protein
MNRIEMKADIDLDMRKAVIKSLGSEAMTTVVVIDNPMTGFPIAAILGFETVYPYLNETIDEFEERVDALFEPTIQRNRRLAS